MRLYFIRHGETDWNIKRRLQGRSDIPLNDEGRRLARVTAEALADVPFSRIYTSPLCRAYETASIIKGSRDIPMIKDERIAEISFGEYEGLCCAGSECNIPETFNDFFDNPAEYKPPKGAEPIEKLCERTADFLREIVYNSDKENETVLVSTHGAALRGLLLNVKGIALKDFWQGGVHKNCAVTIIDVDGGKPVVVEEGKVFY